MICSTHALNRGLINSEEAISSYAFLCTYLGSGLPCGTNMAKGTKLLRYRQTPQSSDKVADMNPYENQSAYWHI